MKEYEALKMFNKHIDELHEYVTICGYHYTVSKAFKEIDPIAYREEFNKWLDTSGIEVTMNKFNVTPYFVLSHSSGRFYRRGYLNEIPENIIELLDEGCLCTIWDIQGNDPEILIERNGWNHPSFAFNRFDELCLGDYV